jgi:hypothetical protein
MTKLASAIVLILAFSVSSFAQTAPKTAKKPSAQARSQPASGCKLVGTVKGTKLWAGDCITPEQRSSAPATEPPVSDQAAGADPAGQK